MLTEVRAPTEEAGRDLAIEVATFGGTGTILDLVPALIGDLITGREFLGAREDLEMAGLPRAISADTSIPATALGGGQLRRLAIGCLGRSGNRNSMEVDRNSSLEAARSPMAAGQRPTDDRAMGTAESAKLTVRGKESPARTQSIARRHRDFGGTQAIHIVRMAGTTEAAGRRMARVAASIGSGAVKTRRASTEVAAASGGRPILAAVILQRASEGLAAGATRPLRLATLAEAAGTSAVAVISAVEAILVVVTLAAAIPVVAAIRADIVITART